MNNNWKPSVQKLHGTLPTTKMEYAYEQLYMPYQPLGKNISKDWKHEEPDKQEIMAIFNVVKLLAG